MRRISASCENALSFIKEDRSETSSSIVNKQREANSTTGLNNGFYFLISMENDNLKYKGFRQNDR